MSNPKISIIIPVFNVEDKIERCVRSLLGQTLKDIELIFIDDCSTDQSIKVLTNLLNKVNVISPSVKKLKQETNGGVARARQKGLENATGEYIIHCDSDDWVEPDWCECLYKEAVRTGADLVSCDYIEDKADGTSESYSCRPVPLTVQRLRLGLTSDIMGYCVNKLIRAEVIKDNHLTFVPDINFLEDMLFNYKALCFCKTISHVDRAFYHYDRSNATSISNSQLYRQVKKIFYVKSEIIKAEPDPELSRKAQLNLCEDQDIINWWTSREITNQEFKELFRPFLTTLWSRKTLGLKWKLLTQLMYTPVGPKIRSRRLR